MRNDRQLFDQTQRNTRGPPRPNDYRLTDQTITKIVAARRVSLAEDSVEHDAVKPYWLLRVVAIRVVSAALSPILQYLDKSRAT